MELEAADVVAQVHINLHEQWKCWLKCACSIGSSVLAVLIEDSQAEGNMHLLRIQGTDSRNVGGRRAEVGHPWQPSQLESS